MVFRIEDTLDVLFQMMVERAGTVSGRTGTIRLRRDFMRNRVNHSTPDSAYRRHLTHVLTARSGVGPESICRVTFDHSE